MLATARHPCRNKWSDTATVGHAPSLARHQIFDLAPVLKPPEVPSVLWSFPCLGWSGFSMPWGQAITLHIERCVQNIRSVFNIESV
jgi:hypothetical protein